MVVSRQKKIDIERNSFDILRLFAALQVMLMHFNSFYFREHETYLHGVGKLWYHGVKLFPGVVILFTLSGFLSAYSLEKRNSVKNFLIRRFYRIYPPLWLCTLINLLFLFVMADVCFDRGILIWIMTQIFGIANTPSFLKPFASGSVNGALWTILVEVQLYCLLAFCFHYLQRISKRVWICLLAVLVLLNRLSLMIGTGMLGKLIERVCIPYAAWFFIGVFFYLYREELLPAAKKYAWILLSIYIGYKLIGYELAGYYTDLVTTILLPVIVIGLGYRLKAVRVKLDITYEVYLYHWIIINLLIATGMIAKIHHYGLICVIYFILVFTLTGMVKGVENVVKKYRKVMYDRRNLYD